MEVSGWQTVVGTTPPATNAWFDFCNTKLKQILLIARRKSVLIIHPVMLEVSYRDDVGCVGKATFHSETVHDAMDQASRFHSSCGFPLPAQSTWSVRDKEQTLEEKLDNVSGKLDVQDPFGSLLKYAFDVEDLEKMSICVNYELASASGIVTYRRNFQTFEKTFHGDNFRDVYLKLHRFVSGSFRDAPVDNPVATENPTQPTET